jgi:hypothetical protein
MRSVSSLVSEAFSWVARRPISTRNEEPKFLAQVTEPQVIVSASQRLLRNGY